MGITVRIPQEEKKKLDVYDKEASVYQLME